MGRLLDPLLQSEQGDYLAAAAAVDFAAVAAVVGAAVANHVADALVVKLY